MLWTAALNIFFSIVFGKMIGLPGILFATSLSKLLTYFWYEPKLLFRDYFLKPCKLYFGEMLKGICITVITIVFGYVVSFWFVPESFAQLVCKGVLVASASLVVVVLCYHKTEGFQMLCRKIKSLVLGLIKKIHP